MDCLFHIQQNISRSSDIWEQVTCNGHVLDGGKLSHRLRPQAWHTLDDCTVTLWVNITSVEYVLLSLLQSDIVAFHTVLRVLNFTETLLSQGGLLLSLDVNWKLRLFTRQIEQWRNSNIHHSLIYNTCIMLRWLQHLLLCQTASLWQLPPGDCQCNWQCSSACLRKW